MQSPPFPFPSTIPERCTVKYPPPPPLLPADSRRHINSVAQQGEEEEEGGPSPSGVMGE